VIIIPEGLGIAALSGQTTDIQVYYDGSQTNVNQILLPVIKEILQTINREITQTPVLFQISEETIQTKDMSMMSFFIPCVLAMSIMFLGLYSAMPLIQQREKKMLKRLGASPISRSTIIFSQVVLRLGLAVLQTIIIIVIGQLMFGVEIL
ncbi:ABC transporter permease, partial [Dehalococcoides mccartyi]